MSTSSEAATGKGLRRDAGIIGLLFASTTSMIGSGWLFGALHASKIAGPAKPRLNGSHSAKRSGIGVG
jgi:hypothetical protein